MNMTRYELQIYKDHRWVSLGEKSNPLESRRAERTFKEAGYKTRRLRVKREIMFVEEIR